LPSCAENMKEKSIEAELSRSLSNFETSTNENLESSLEAMNSTLNSSISSTLDELERNKYGKRLLVLRLIRGMELENFLV